MTQTRGNFTPLPILNMSISRLEQVPNAVLLSLFYVPKIVFQLIPSPQKYKRLLQKLISLRPKPKIN